MTGGNAEPIQYYARGIHDGFFKDCDIAVCDKEVRRQKDSSYKVDKLPETVRFAPSVVNLQQGKITIVTDQNVKEQLRPAAFNQEQVSTSSHRPFFCADPDYNRLISRLGVLLKKSGTPEEMQDKIAGRAARFANNRSLEQKRAWSGAPDVSCTGQCLKRCKTRGFDSCPMGGFDPKEFSRILKIPGPRVLVMLCPPGYASDKLMPTVR